MLVMVKHPDGWVDQVLAQQQAAVSQFDEDSAERRYFKRGEFASGPQSDWALIQVVSGVIGLMQDGNRVLALEPGDCWLAYPGALFDWYQEGAVDVQFWTWSQFTVQQSLSVVHGFQDLILELLNYSTQVPPDPTPGFEFFKSGDVIIQEGDPADSVYTLIQGKAKVMIGGVTVGVAKEHEILGLQAMLLKTHRTASVIADGPCSAVKVTYDKFRSLIEARPELVLSTMETMAQQIERANQRLTKE
ncbi:Crp/Fnr family transcriptional regulator [Reinekea blandensis]|uniref:cAMP-binding protein-catabolite gene activator and regulatory subunit of cAMP-dependent protein kinase n=1 Tax=Reinekea blandensis MED297 TaxID=314283 RepID=A4BJJ1_9GAMM|nr:cyclic nucleotide-binding domain-containing protein [Reinekea blandensis]EAR07695.1 cAMP-binding protein - catabolite gene activator and regulatory subunit of cAMP-dependent protein kinase [Reinekea sp. MED297] [Reinekea blandensis MED297]